MRRKLIHLFATLSIILVAAVVAILPEESVNLSKETTKANVNLIENNLDYMEIHAGVSNIISTPADLLLVSTDSKEEATESNKNTTQKEDKQRYDVPLSKELQNKVSYYIDYMDIDLDESYFYALIYHESRFNSKATGSSGDSGYCQILQKYFGYIYDNLCKDYPELVEQEKFVYDVYNEETNLVCGIYWLSKCAKEVSGNELSRNNLSSALTAYNRGVSGAQAYFKKHNTYVTNYSSSIIEVAKYLQDNNSLPN